ncbi:hypothetical protein EUGRSUZ_B02844 [Eucalyptus grandis]|uniref:Uncharacterized protein n=2 Tax=Eucalyptus grandis TaxID=71139 RepID=A0ACC3LVK2_EUCGR|nr:hypothetical protein EUGRSUZ_B02844 [Eucalyptus grandis]
MEIRVKDLPIAASSSQTYLHHIFRDKRIDKRIGCEELPESLMNLIKEIYPFTGKIIILFRFVFHSSALGGTKSAI